MADLVQYYGTGRRKSSVARVFLRPGNGEFTINGRKFDEYFVTEAQRYAARRPLQTSETAGTFNVIASVSGGGERPGRRSQDGHCPRAARVQRRIAQSFEG